MENQVDFEGILACPRCGSKLGILKFSWSCPQCRGKWPIDSDGVVRLLDSSEFFGVDQEGMRKLLEEMRGMCAEEFFSNIERFEKTYRDFEYDYCLNPARADWAVLGDFKDKIIVDLGCGYGAVSLPLTSRAKAVVGVDHTLERVKFFSLVARFRGITNIIAIHGDMLNLPLKEGTVDIFICMGLMEWAGTWEEHVKPIEVQREFLAHLYRYLTERGQVWIGIENRLNPSYLIGKTHHGDLPFTPLMPRIVANEVSRLFKGEPYKTWTHSRRAYRKLLQKVGFETVEFYYPLPGYQIPRFILSSAQRKLFSFIRKNPGIGRNGSITTRVGVHLYGILDRMGLLSVFAPAFLIKAAKRS